MNNVVSKYMIRKLLDFQSKDAYQSWKIEAYGNEPVYPPNGTKEEKREFKNKQNEWERQFYITTSERLFFERGYRLGLIDSAKALRGELMFPDELVRWLKGETVE